MIAKTLKLFEKLVGVHATGEDMLSRLSTGFVCLCIMLFAQSSLMAAGTGLVFVSNEKSNTISVLDGSHKVIDTIETCARPRGMHFSADRKLFYVGCADDSQIAVYDIASRKLLKRILDVAEPETFDLHPNGRHLYVSNEEDAAATIFDVETGQQIAEFFTGEEPEGVQVTSDGRRVFVASEAANLVHVIDSEARKVIADIPVDTRPRALRSRPMNVNFGSRPSLRG